MARGGKRKGAGRKTDKPGRQRHQYVIDPELAATFWNWCREQDWPLGETLEMLMEEWITHRVRNLLPYMAGVREHSPNLAFLCDDWMAKHPEEFAPDKKAVRRFASAVAVAYKTGLAAGKKPDADSIAKSLGFGSRFEIENALCELQAQGHLARIEAEIGAER